jgi:hypothetical protein
VADIIEEVSRSLPLERRRDSLNPADSAGATVMVGLQETPAQLFYEAGSFEAADFTQGSRQFAGLLGCGELLQNRRGRDDALVHRCRHTQQLVPIVADEIDVDPAPR